jgi:hypothetical protein
MAETPAKAEVVAQCCLACPPPAGGERPVDVAGVFLERHPDLAGRS